MREDDDAAVPYCASLGDAGKVVMQRILFCVDDDSGKLQKKPKCSEQESNLGRDFPMMF